MMHITLVHRILQLNLGPALTRLVLVLVTAAAGILCQRADASRLPAPQRADTHGSITSSPALPTRALLRNQNAAQSGVCGWLAGKYGVDPDAPLQCPSTQDSCFLIRPYNVIGCCNSQARSVAASDCEYYTACYASTDADKVTAEDERVQICTYTAPWTITTKTSTFDPSDSTSVTFTTTLVTTSTESECVTWAFEIDGTIQAPTYGCARFGTSIVVKTALSDRMTAQITRLYDLDKSPGGSPQTSATKIDPPTATTASPSRGSNTLPGLPISTSPPTSPPTSPAASPPGHSQEAIVGVVVGVLAALAAVSIYFGIKYWKKRNPRRLPNPEVTTGGALNKSSSLRDTGNESNSSGNLVPPGTTLRFELSIPGPSPIPTPTPTPPPQRRYLAVHPPSSQYQVPPPIFGAVAPTPNVTTRRYYHHTGQEPQGQASEGGRFMLPLSKAPPVPKISPSLHQRMGSL